MKKNRQLVIVILALQLVVPISLAQAQVQLPQEAEQSNLAIASTIQVSNDERILAPSAKAVSIKLTESNYQIKQKQARAQKIARARVQAPTAPVKIANSTPDPGLVIKRDWVQRAAAAYGIDWRILEAVWQVESGKRWYTGVSSYAGAQGPCQFMPGTWRAYAQDGNGDGVKNVNDARDCLFGAAKLLAVNGAAAGDNHRALFGYNHSLSYVQKVSRIANGIP